MRVENSKEHICKLRVTQVQDTMEGCCFCCASEATANLSWALDISGPMGPLNPP